MYEYGVEEKFMCYRYIPGYPGVEKDITSLHWHVFARAGAISIIDDGDDRGCVVNHNGFKEMLKSALSEFDGKLICEEGEITQTIAYELSDRGYEIKQVKYRPTPEAYARSIYDSMRYAGAPVLSIDVYETPEEIARFQVNFSM